MSIVLVLFERWCVVVWQHRISSGFRQGATIQCDHLQVSRNIACAATCCRTWQQMENHSGSIQQELRTRAEFHSPHSGVDQEPHGASRRGAKEQRAWETVQEAEQEPLQGMPPN
jgi:hypothetical protein